MTFNKWEAINRPYASVARRMVGVTLATGAGIIGLCLYGPLAPVLAALAGVGILVACTGGSN